MEKMQLGIELERELFLLAVVLGCGLGLLYDIFRVFRAALPHGKILTFFEDILYTFLYGFALFTFCTGLTGAIRAFVLVGMLMGSLFEHLTVGNAVVFVLRKLFGTVRKLLAKTFSPVVKLITKWTGGLTGGFVKKCKISFKRKKNFQKHLKTIF